MAVENNQKTTGGATGKGFKPGQSGNPGGRPKVAKEFKERCRDFMSETGFQTLIEIASNPKDRDRFRAIELIAGYGLGKPKQGLELSGEEGGNINVIIEPASQYKKSDK